MTTLLHRFTVKPHHLDKYLPIWRAEVALRRRHGFVMERAFVETDAEPKVTWLYSHPDAAVAELAVAADPETAELDAMKRNHVFRNTRIRPVRVEALTPSDGSDLTAVMRRYSIVGSWSEFLAIWREIVPVRERHGFPCLFAVADEDENMFTWAFAYDGEWADFPAAQRDYYRDPDRVRLRSVFDYLADYTIHPARQLTLP